MKKRLLSFLVAVCLFIPCMFMLTACGKANVTGTYSIYSVSYNDITWTKEQYEANKESEDLTETEEEFLMYAAMMFESAMSFELKDDNTFTTSSTMFGQTSTETGTWSKDGDKITITMNPEEEGDETESQELTYSDGKLVMSMTEEDMVITITLAKN